MSRSNIGLFVLCMVWMLQGCQFKSSSECIIPGIRLRIQDASKQTPKVFQLTIRTADGTYQTTVCKGSQGHQNNIQCTASGAHVSVSAETTLQWTLKAHGFVTQSAESKASLEAQTQHPTKPNCTGKTRQATLSIQLKKLDAFKVDKAYRTGFSKQDGKQHFRSMAVETQTAMGKVWVVKFYIDQLKTQPRIYFMDTKKFPLHYKFVRNVLQKPLSPDDYALQTYNATDRDAVAGSIVYYPEHDSTQSTDGKRITHPLTIEFFPHDKLSAQMAQNVLQLLEERMLFSPLEGTTERVYYVPSGIRQTQEALKQKELFARRNSLWIRKEELYKGVRFQLLNQGIAYGILRRLSPEELQKTVVSFRDILILTRLPNDLPIVGGTITEELQTPLAHVNLAARARKTPNLALLEASKDERIRPFLKGKQWVRFEVTHSGFTIQKATQKEAEDFWRKRHTQPIQVPQADVQSKSLISFSDLRFSDSNKAGAKAANLGELYTLLGRENISPDGFAVPFYYYDQFMRTQSITSSLCTDAKGDCIDEQRAVSVCQNVERYCIQNGAGQTLQTYIESLLQDSEFKQQSVYREAALDGFRYIMHHIPVDTAFAQTLNERVQKLVGEHKIRMRSSTNAEDLAQFSGAGLYRSISASTAISKKKPSSRIRKVWSSIWSWKAFEERAFWNIPHTQIYMAVAIHRSFPNEEANGVLITKNLMDRGNDGYYVNVQKGEVSVTNPEGGARPEVFSILPSGNEIHIIRQNFSSLSPATALLTPNECKKLFDTARRIQTHFAPLYKKSLDLALDMEFKYIAPNRQLIIKQSRPYFQAR